MQLENESVWAQGVDEDPSKNEQNQNKQAMQGKIEVKWLPIVDNRSRSSTAWPCALGEATRTTQSPKQRLHENAVSGRVGLHNKTTTYVKTPPFRTRGRCGQRGQPLHLIRRETRPPRDVRPRWQVVVSIVHRFLRDVAKQKRS